MNVKPKVLLFLLLTPLLVLAIFGCAPKPEPVPEPGPAPEPEPEPEQTPLVCYDAESEPIEAEVTLVTQFGTESAVALRDLRWLCEPAFKSHDEATLPRRPPPVRPLSCYAIEGEPIGETVTLADRNDFFAGEARVLEPFMFCDPVEEKVRESGPAQETEMFPSHLNAYRLEAPELAREVTIFTHDQFGPRSLTFRRSHHLLEPALKNMEGPLPDLEPYHCYVVEMADEPRPVEEEGIRVIDQFGEHALRLKLPAFFCDPAKKERG